MEVVMSDYALDVMEREEMRRLVMMKRETTPVSSTVSTYPSAGVEKQRNQLREEARRKREEDRRKRDPLLSDKELEMIMGLKGAMGDSTEWTQDQEDKVASLMEEFGAAYMDNFEKASTELDEREKIVENYQRWQIIMEKMPRVLETSERPSSKEEWERRKEERKRQAKERENIRAKCKGFSLTEMHQLRSIGDKNRSAVGRKKMKKYEDSIKEYDAAYADYFNKYVQNSRKNSSHSKDLTPPSNEKWRDIFAYLPVFTSPST